MSSFTTTIMTLRAGTELAEAACYGLLVAKPGNGKAQKMTWPLVSLVTLPTFVAIADTFLATMRVLGKSVNPRIELGLLPVRVIMCVVGLRNEKPIMLSGLSQGAACFANRVEAFKDKISHHESIKGVLSIVEIAIRTWNIIDLAQEVKYRYNQKPKRIWK